MKKYILYFLLFVTNLLFSQVKMKIDTTQIRIGEQITYEISTENIPKVIFPNLKLDSLKKVELVKELPLDTLKNRLYKKYFLTSFDSGQYVIPSQEVFIDNQRYIIDSILINVGTVVVDTTKQGLFPIKPNYKSPPKTWHDYLYILYWILGLLGLILLLWWLVIKSKKLIKLSPNKVWSPFEIALNQLKDLDNKNLLEQQKIKEYYTELTDIVRNYIEKDLKISAMELTSDELINLLKKQNKYKKLGISKEQIIHLHLFLQNADLVKFAKSKPELVQIQNDRNFAEKVLNEIKVVVTKPELDENGNPVIDNNQEEIKTINKSKKKIFSVLIVSFILILTAIISYYGINTVKDTIVGHPSKQLLEKEWYRATYGYPSVSIESPVILKAKEIVIPQENNALISNSSFEFGSIISGLYMSVSTSELNSEIEFDMENAIKGTVQMMQNQKGISDLVYESSDVDIDDIPGKKVVGKLLFNGKKMSFSLYIFNNNSTVQQILMIRKSDDIYAQKIEKRLFESVVLNKRTE